MRTLVLGASGLLGSHLLRRLRLESPPRVDLRDSVALHRLVSQADIVINCAAGTAVDAAEHHEAEARRVNATAVADLARACADHDAWLFHISTDFVFSGDSGAVYLEAEPVSPLNAYGRTKAEGEVSVVNYERGTVIRTAWLYGDQRSGFIPAVLRRARGGTRFPVVDDQLGQPTFVRDAADRIVDIVDHVISSRAPSGIWHATNSGFTSRWHLASQVVALTGGDPDLVTPACSVIEPGTALRPRLSVLSDARGLRYGLAPMRPWTEALSAALPIVMAT